MENNDSLDSPSPDRESRNSEQPERQSDQPEQRTEQPPFFSVSPLKFAVMSLMTFGLYDSYWMYKNWKIIAERRQLETFPLFRAIFGYFFVIQLLRQLRSDGLETGTVGRFPGQELAVCWIVVSLMGRLPEPFFVIGCFAFLALLPAVIYANKVNRQVAPDAPINSQFKLWNWVGIIIGIILWVLVFAGILIGDDPEFQSKQMTEPDPQQVQSEETSPYSSSGDESSERQPENTDVQSEPDQPPEPADSEQWQPRAIPR